MVSGENGERVSGKLKDTRQRCREVPSATEIWIDNPSIHLVGFDETVVSSSQ